MKYRVQGTDPEGFDYNFLCDSWNEAVELVEYFAGNKWINISEEK